MVDMRKFSVVSHQFRNQRKIRSTEFTEIRAQRARNIFKTETAEVRSTDKLSWAEVIHCAGPPRDRDAKLWKPGMCRKTSRRSMRQSGRSLPTKTVRRRGAALRSKRVLQR